MKKVCFVNTNKFWGGGEKWHYENARALSERDYEVYFIGDKNGKLAKKIGGKKINLYKLTVKNLSFLNIFKIVKTYLFLKKNEIDTVIINQSNDLKLISLSAKLAKVKKIIYRRGSAIPIKNSFLNRFIFKNIVNKIIANSNETKKTINLKANLFPEKDIEVIYNGINIDVIKKIDKKNTLRMDLEIDNDKVLMVNIGRLTEQKGHKDLFEALKLLKEKTGNFVVLLLGTGEKEEELKKYVKDMNLEENIKFLGFVENVYEILKEADFLVHTAHWEGFGYVIVEAFACGKPVVATEISNIPEILDDLKYGYLVPKSDVKEIMKALFKMMNNYSEFNAETLIKRAEDFDFSIKLNELEEII